MLLPVSSWPACHPPCSPKGRVQRSEVGADGISAVSVEVSKIRGNAAELTVYGRAAKVLSTPGGVAERPNAPVLKTGAADAPPESHPIESSRVTTQRTSDADP